VPGGAKLRGDAKTAGWRLLADRHRREDSGVARVSAMVSSASTTVTARPLGAVAPLVQVETVVDQRAARLPPASEVSC
jgi:hypothetical protein